ncbi:MAG: alpha-mannosidase [Fimbriimonadaceae bacterium]|nr:alpha-mannosidase [Fimbriimonadaceae bacterium]
MHKFEANLLARARQFMKRELLDHLVTQSIPLATEFCAGVFASGAAANKSGEWQSVEPGFVWGPAYQEGWYRIKGNVPAEWKERSVALAYDDPNRAVEDSGHFESKKSVEGTVWRDGAVIGALDWTHLNLRLYPSASGKEKVNLLVQTYAPNKETTVHGWEKPRTELPATFEGFHLVCLDEELIQLYHDMVFIESLAVGLPENDPLRAHCVRALNEVCDVYEADRRRSIAQCRRLIKDRLEAQSQEVAHTITPIGHAHLDTAWLWPLAVTHLKMAHTTAIQLDLMERYPEHVFAHSQASQYEWIEKEHPALFERVKGMIRKGQWEVVGSMWVEADCNLTGGESLVRQFLYGRSYFRDKFGVTTDDMWLPDVFGYSAALPQILSQFDIKYFLTQKMSWNQFNKMPHNTFWWQGIDGSRVWTHFPPADTYVADARPKTILESVRKHRDHGRSDHSILLFGYGDGGGGPTEQHLELLRRARRFPGLPVVETKQKALDFFEIAYEESEDLRTWAGELYFEYHRGTYTSQAANKWHNRKCEFLLRDAEWLAAFAPKAYPAQELERLWKVVLLNQFHDIIPGSSVREVYEDSDKDYAMVHERGEALLYDSLTALAAPLGTENMEHPIAIFHNATLPAEASLEWADETVPESLHTNDEVLPVQLVEEEGNRRLIFPTPTAGLGSITSADLRSEAPLIVPRLKASVRRLENQHWSVRFDGNGNISSVRSQDEDPLEFIRPGALANVFQLMDDHPLFWSAWDVEQFSFDTAKDLLRADSVEVVERGPVRVAIEVIRRFGKSAIRQRISLGPTPGIRFDTVVDWHEDNKMLKVAFPLNIHSDFAKFEIQFGHANRPTHRNTTWDEARFEVCAQKWADLSEAGQGVALLNDSKYGYDVLGDTMRLSLLRAPKAPDPLCDMGRHRFTYVLLPHYDDLIHSEVVAAAYALNATPRVTPLTSKKGVAHATPKLVSSDDRNLVVETVKRSEDGQHLIVRLYEAHGARGAAYVHCGKPIAAAWRANLEENPQETLVVDENGVRVDYRPFEIITLRLEV